MSEVTEEVVHTEVEVQALARGWKPETDFQADPKNEGKKWRTAEEFMDRQSLFDKIDEQHRQLKDAQKGLKALQEYNLRIEKLSYEKAIADLRRERKQAREEGEFDRVDEIDDKLEALKEQKPRPQVEATQEVIPPQVKNWMDANPWYTNNPEMRAFADSMANALTTKGIFGDALLEQVAEKTKKAFEVSSRNPNKDKALPMEKGSNKQKQEVPEPLSDMEEQIIKTMVKAGVPNPNKKGEFMTADEYREQLRRNK